MPTVVNPDYQLKDGLTATRGRIFLTGTQALLRMLIARKRADARRGLNTAGFVSGYRGSPLGGVDMTLWRHQDLLDQHAIRFVPAVNEDLAATIIMGTQQAGQREDRTVDGVFALWYGKGPGVDRAGDALHHGNAAGASANGGVLLVVGDDHTAESSSIPHASDASLAAWRIPVIHPASVAEYEAFGLWGWELSRYAGTWVAFKAITETVESGRSFEIEPAPDFTVETDDALAGSLPYSARDFLSPAMEDRMIARLDAVRAFSRRHPLDRIVDPAPQARVGIVSIGKAHLDTLEALATLDRPATSMGAGRSARPAIRHYKVGLGWPLDADGLRAFARGLDHILVVEEKNALVEGQIKDMLYNADPRPTVCGRLDLRSNTLIPASGPTRPERVAAAIRRWLHQTGESHSEDEPPQTGGPRVPGKPLSSLTRRPYFCSGCPHSTSTRVPEGSQALGGVGCHYMASWMDRNTSGLTQMGGEGADWIGLAPYTHMPHVFQNMGEGTYFHSGYLAIRQAIAAGANITYKILFNDAVAMTGGQAVDGRISVPQICQQLRGEGVQHIIITTDDPSRYRGVALVAGVSVHPRHELDRLQTRLRDTPGVTVLIHDQVCAAEKRRRRKHNRAAQPARRLFINPAVCEGCGDCSVQSNCLSVVPLETPLGRKRAIDQSSCNTDLRCADGFCPSFVSVIGGRPRRTATSDTHDLPQGPLPQPRFIRPDAVCHLLIAGVGGTGVVTVGALVAMAAHLEGRGSSVLDITGLAQKGGTVVSHVKLSPDATPTTTVRIDARQTDTALLCDAVAGTQPQVLAALCPGRTHAVANTWLAPTAEFIQDPDVRLDATPLLNTLQAALGDAAISRLDAHSIAQQHFGDGILANIILLGHAWQDGAIPVGEAALRRAIELNGVAVQANLEAFDLGRQIAHAATRPATTPVPARQTIRVPAPEPLEALLERCRQGLAAWQNRAWAARFMTIIQSVQAAETRMRPHSRPHLTPLAARSLHKLMSYKDEYEVARLFTDPVFRRQLEAQFEGDYSLRFHLAPPLFARRDPHTGLPRKTTFGPWLETVFKALAHGRHLRGTLLDPFGWSAERRMERRLIRNYQRALLELAATLSEDTWALGLELATLPMAVRGFGHVKKPHADRFEQRLGEIHEELARTRREPSAALRPAG